MKEKAEYIQHGPRTKRWKNKDSKNRNPNLTQISLFAHCKDVNTIEILIKLGFYSNRSEALRYYIKDGIKRDLKIIQLLERLKAYDTNELGLILAQKRVEKYKQIQNLKLIPNSVSDLAKRVNETVE